MTKTVLVVEDESAIREMLSLVLSDEGYDVVAVADGHQAQAALDRRLPDVILLDWMLPGVSGLELARRWKRNEVTREVPIIMLTARMDEDDKVRGLEAGADDYVGKPFSRRELIARVRAHTRRREANVRETLEVDGLSLDTAAQRVHVRGKRLDLGPTEYRLLHFFMTHPERVYSRAQLLDHVWGSEVYIEERTVDVHIRRLRKVLEAHGHDRYIQTVRGSGYRYSEQV